MMLSLVSQVKTAGHDAVLHIVPGMICCVQLFSKEFPSGQRATAEAALFLREGFAAPNESSVSGLSES